MVTRFILPVLGTVAFCSIISCSTMGSKGDAVTMDSTAMFDKSQVAVFMNEHAGNNKKAQSYFAKGVDAYRNKKNPGQAYELFTRSILLYPTNRAYYELGNVCNDLKAYDRSLAAYKMAEQLGYEPVSKLMYNIACVYSLQEKEDTAAKYVEYAIESGYSNQKRIMEDPDLANARKTEMFKESYRDAMSGVSDPEVTLWQSFKREFKVKQAPFVLDMNTAKELDEDHMVTYEFEKYISEMKTEKFSREVGKDFYYYAIVEDNSNFTAMIYAIKNVMMGEQAPCQYVLVSFDKKGTLIDKKAIAGQLELDKPYLVCTMKAGNRFETKSYKNIYEKDVEKEGYENNPVVKSELIGTANYKIDDKGKIVTANADVAFEKFQGKNSKFQIPS